MSNQSQFIRQTSPVFMACGLVASLLLMGLIAPCLAQEAATKSQVHISGNMDSFNKGLRGFDGGACEPKFLAYDFKKRSFPDITRWISHYHKRMAIKAGAYAYGVAKDADLGVVPVFWFSEKWTDG